MSTSREMVKGFITHLFCTPLGLAITSVVAGLALVIARRPSTKTIRKLWGKKKRSITHMCWNAHGIPGATERGGDGAGGWGQAARVLLLLGSRLAA